MQLFALDSKGPLLAAHAQKHKNYQCPECLQPVRLRSGPHRQPHYYHLERTAACRQQGKSAEHLQAQLKLFSLIPEGECSLERPFPSIGRIADVVWETANIVFEVQCSPISKEEVEARTVDYRSMGMHIVWILHDKRFNLKNLSAAEEHLRHQPCYYTNITPSGSGMFYDQFEIIRGPRRLFKGPSLPVALSRPIPIEPKLLTSSLKHLGQRASLWDLSFEGDLLNRLAQAPDSSLLPLVKIEKRFDAQPRRFKPALAIRRLYTLILDGLIRSCSSD